MKNPKIKTKVVHSQKEGSYNVIGETLGKKHKIAVVPYIRTAGEILTEQTKEAYDHAVFISNCFNNSDKICEICS